MSPTYPRFVLFGDSITQFATKLSPTGSFVFTAALQNEYIRKLDVINRGFSGYNTTQSLNIFPEVIKPHVSGQSRIALVTIFLGANDCCLSDSYTKQHVALEIYRSNLVRMIQHPALASHSPRIILITPPPINEYGLERWAQEAGNDNHKTRTAEHTKLYADACREVGGKTGVEVVDLWSLFMHAAGWKEGQPLEGSRSLPENKILAQYLSDGLHFDSVAYEAFFKALMDVIRTRCPEVAPESETLPSVFPVWTDAPGLQGADQSQGRRE